MINIALNAVRRKYQENPADLRPNLKSTGLSTDVVPSNMPPNRHVWWGVFRLTHFCGNSQLTIYTYLIFGITILFLPNHHQGVIEVDAMRIRMFLRQPIGVSSSDRPDVLLLFQIGIISVQLATGCFII